MRLLLILVVVFVQLVFASSYTDTYNKAWRAASAHYQLSQDTYRELLAKDKIDKIKKARICLNMGNDSIRNDGADTAIAQYTQGLKYDPKNERLKANLELAKKIQKEKKQQKQNQDKKQDKQDKDKQKQQQKQKQAEQQLNAFKNQEQQDMQKYMQQRKQKVNVEKDW